MCGGGVYFVATLGRLEVCFQFAGSADTRGVVDLPDSMSRKQQVREAEQNEGE